MERRSGRRGWRGGAGELVGEEEIRWGRVVVVERF